MDRVKVAVKYGSWHPDGFPVLLHCLLLDMALLNNVQVGRLTGQSKDHLT